MNENNKSLDIIGIKPIGETINSIFNKSIEGIEGFLKSVCKPALDEFGLYCGDKVRVWRLNNIIKILEKSQNKLTFINDKLELKIDPKIALGIIENGSLTDDITLQELWSGLFAASCTSEVSDENIIFVDILKKLTSSQAKILMYSCENASKIVYDDDLIIAEQLTISCEELKKITGITELYKLDRELDYLNSLDLIGQSLFSGGSGINIPTKLANITPKALTLNLYVKCQGFNNHPKLFWNENIVYKDSADIKPFKILGS